MRISEKQVDGGSPEGSFGISHGLNMSGPQSDHCKTAGGPWIRPVGVYVFPKFSLIVWMKWWYLQTDPLFDGGIEIVFLGIWQQKCLCWDQIWINIQPAWGLNIKKAQGVQNSGTPNDDRGYPWIVMNCTYLGLTPPVVLLWCHYFGETRYVEIHVRWSKFYLHTYCRYSNKFQKWLCTAPSYLVQAREYHMEIRKAQGFDLREDVHWKDARRIPMFRNGQKAMSEYSTLQSKLTDVGRSQWEVALKCNSDTANPSKWRDGLSQFPTVENSLSSCWKNCICSSRTSSLYQCHA